MDTNWYYRQGDADVGPILTVELRRLIESGRLTAAHFVRSVDEPTWRPAGMYAVFKELFSTAAELPAMLPIPPPRLPTSAKPIWPWVVGAAGFLSIVGLAVILLAALGGSARPATTFSSDTEPLVAPALAISGEDATEDLGRIVAGMTEQQKTAIGQLYLATGQDFYGARVRITNCGDAPIWVRPENVRLHLNGETVGVQSSRDPRFLQSTLLQPGYYVEGLVIYRAYTEAGAAMRLGAGSISYVND